MSRCSWTIKENIVCNFAGRLDMNTCYGFDLDDTIICASDHKSRSTVDDWQFAYPWTPKILEKYRGMSIIFSNQRGLKSTEKVLAWIEKLNDVFAKLGFVIPTIAALKDDEYRKPSLAMLKYAIKDPGQCRFVFVGDAWRKGSDVHDGPTDLMFAENATSIMRSSAFRKPEEFFIRYRRPTRWLYSVIAVVLVILILAALVFIK